MLTIQKKTLKGNFTTSQGRLFGSPTLRSDDSWNCQTGGWISTEAAKGTQTKLPQGGLSDSVATKLGFPRFETHKTRKKNLSSFTKFHKIM